MEQIIEKHIQIIRDTPDSFTRNFMSNIFWEERLIGIKGAKGVGKTTLLLQHIKQHLKGKKVIYFSLDDIYFFGNNLTEVVTKFIHNGYEYFFIDEVHKYPNWSIEIKNLHDTYRKIKIVFTGSSVLHLLDGAADLSRRAIIYDLQGLSFREYIEIKTNEKISAFSLDELLKNHQEIATEILEKIRPYEFFNDYLKNGYYPFFIEAPKTYNLRVENAIYQSLENDLPLLKNITAETVFKLKRLLYVIAESVPFKPNIQKLSERTGISRNSLVLYLRYIEEAKIIKQLYTGNQGISALQKPQKIYFENPNLIYALSSLSSQIGTVRETFVMNQLAKDHQINYPKKGDFLIDDKFTFEVGGKNKSKKQIADINNSYLIADNIEVGFGNKIPLWIIGFLY